MSRTEKASAVLTVRLDDELERSLSQEARRRHKSKSAVVREILAEGLGERRGPSLAEEARRQSLLVSGRASERDALEFVEHAADTRGWE